MALGCNEHYLSLASVLVAFMKQTLVLAVLLCLGTTPCLADTGYIKRVTDTLSSAAFSGRGYVNNGMQLAADFIGSQMMAIGLRVQRQPFSYPVNRFPKKMALTIGGKKLVPGVDFLVDPNSRSCHAAGKLEVLDSIHYINKAQRVLVRLVHDKLTWSVAATQGDLTLFQVKASSITNVNAFSARVDAEAVPNFTAYNVMGFLPGSAHSDSLLVFTAHYDHLGMMGQNTMFAGANDNASGVALMLSMARHYAAHPAKYNILFIAFAGEEAGLIGSKYFVDHPLVPLQNIRFLINLDLMGNGDEGITVVNATEYTAAFAQLQQINQQHQWLAAVNGRGKAQNSDHYWFSEHGVPAFFIYTLGKRKSYHDVYDVSETLLWPEGDDLQSLLLAFADRLMQGCCW